MGSRLHLCLQCVYIGCYQYKHLFKHFQETKHYLGFNHINNEIFIFHNIAMSIDYNEIYCYQCGDYVYDSEFDIAVSIESTNAIVLKHHLNGSFFFNIIIIIIYKGNYNLENALFKSWIPTRDEAISLSKKSCIYIENGKMLGLRGLYNLGNTCFMNCILQALLHNPLIRNYFLSDMHNRFLCSEKRKSEKTRICLGCEMDLLFSEIFSGEQFPHIPHHFLYSVWKYSNDFAGYEQKDAHEFLIFLLNVLHSHFQGNNNNNIFLILWDIRKSKRM